MKSKHNSPQICEWSYMIRIDEIGNKPFSLTIEADDEEKEFVARRLGISKIKNLSADISIYRTRENSNIFHVSGKLTAFVIQQCVVTLEDIENTIEEEFDGWFTDQERTLSFMKAKRERLKSRTGADLPIQDEHEDPEEIHNGMIDIGELTVQHLSLALPQYPHGDQEIISNNPNSQLISDESDNKSKEESLLRKNPFASLKNWKERQKG